MTLTLAKPSSRAINKQIDSRHHICNSGNRGIGGVQKFPTEVGKVASWLWDSVCGLRVTPVVSAIELQFRLFFKSPAVALAAFFVACIPLLIFVFCALSHHLRRLCYWCWFHPSVVSNWTTRILFFSGNLNESVRDIGVCVWGGGQWIREIRRHRLDWVELAQVDFIIYSCFWRPWGSLYRRSFSFHTLCSTSRDLTLLHVCQICHFVKHCYE